MYPWPLPEGHTYGPGMKPSRHSGDDVVERIALAATQRRIRQHWGVEVHPSGRYDGQTQKALAALQTQLGLDPTGILDRDLWEVLWK